jgi:predicted aspartyl protease
MRRCVAGFLLCASNTFAATPLADVPLIGDNHRPRIAVDINGHRGVQCILDTGATVGVIGRDIADGAERIGESHVTTANGAYGMPLLRVRDIVIGNAHTGDVEFVQRDASWFGHGGTAPCILGMSFAQRFTVDLDGHARRLRLFPAGTNIDAILDPSQRAGASIKASFDNDVIETEALVNGFRTAARIDTGWGFVTPNRVLLDRLGYRRTDARYFTKNLQQADSGRIVSVRMTTLQSVQLGKVRTSNVLSDADPDRQAASIVGRRSDPYLQIGWPLLSEHRFIFDVRTRRAAFVP